MSLLHAPADQAVLLAVPLLGGPGCPPCGGGDPSCITTPCTTLPAPLNFAGEKLCQFLKNSILFGKAPQRKMRDDRGALEGWTHMWWQFWGFWGAHTAGYMGLVTTMWVPIGAEVPVLLPKDHPNTSQGRQKDFGKNRILKNFHVSLNSLRNSNFGGFGGPMAWAKGAQRPLRGSPWVLKYPYCHQMITQIHPRGDKRVSEKFGF